MTNSVSGRYENYKFRKFRVLRKDGSVDEVLGLSTLRKGDNFTVVNEDGKDNVDPVKVWIASSDPFHNKEGVLFVEAEEAYG